MIQICENCGNDYDKVFTVTMNGEQHVFDCFECAINMLAPLCSSCGSLIIGHGAEANDKMFCSGHCAKTHGFSAVDRVI